MLDQALGVGFRTPSPPAGFCRGDFCSLLHFHQRMRPPRRFRICQESSGALKLQPLLWLQEFGAVWMRFKLMCLAVGAAGVAKTDETRRTRVWYGIENLHRGWGPGCCHPCKCLGVSALHGHLSRSQVVCFTVRTSMVNFKYFCDVSAVNRSLFSLSHQMHERALSPGTLNPQNLNF